LAQIQKTVLPNGIRVITENIPFVQSFALGFWFNAGSRDESKTNNGLSHFLEHMLFKGTKKRSAKNIADEIEGYGGYLNAFTSKEQTCFYGRGLTKHLERTFKVLSDMIQNSVFKETEVAKEAGVIIDELYDIEDTPEELIFDRFESNIYQGNSLSYPVIGNEENIRNFTKEDLFKFIEDYYGFDNLIISASGAVEHEKVVKYAEKYIEKKLGKSKTQRSELKMFSPEDQQIQKENVQTHVILGRSGYGYDNFKRTDLLLLSYILGEGSSSRLFQSVREKNGISYAINSFLNSYQDVSSFGVYFSTNEKLVGKTLKIIEREFNKLKNKPVSDKELRRAKESLKGNIILGMENLSNRMLRLAQSETYYHRHKSVEETIEEINGKSKEDINSIANEFLDFNEISKVIISSNRFLQKNAA
jgi:predicted Zn-dependent peptidase